MGNMRTYRPTEFSVLLRKIREGAGKSRYSLAQFSGVDEAYLLRLESGERQNPSRDVVVKLGLALVADSQSVTLHDVNGLLLAANHAPLLSRGANDFVELTMVDQRSSFLEWVPGTDTPSLGSPGIGVNPPRPVVSVEAVPEALGHWHFEAVQGGEFLADLGGPSGWRCERTSGP